MQETVRAVLVGCGGMSTAWLNAAKETPGVEIVGLVDIREEAARKRSQEFGLAQAVTGTEMKSIIQQTRADVVFDCTIPEAHLSVVTTALQLGCHVLGEKPLADSMDNARKMVAAAKQAGKIYTVIQNRRYDPNIRRLKALLASGAIGPITTLYSDFFIGAHFGGFRDRMEHPLVLDMAIHTFDAARFLTAADPVAVYCKEWNPQGSWYDHNASAVAIFEMTNGIIYNYRGAWSCEGLHTKWESDWRVLGVSGSVKWDGTDKFEAQVVAERGGFNSKLRDVEIPACDPGSKVGGHVGLMREFIHCVRTGGTPETICTNNI
ncbi:MAG: Gfo/Idh/MocA family oxidoreductase, partial [Planctomycetes bacterium]|nr:Gfo/Idh/MocA family oxidoreductase [Planctomycetota bacterium]